MSMENPEPLQGQKSDSNNTALNTFNRSCGGCSSGVEEQHIILEQGGLYEHKDCLWLTLSQDYDLGVSGIQETTVGEMFSVTVLFPGGDVIGCKAEFSSDVNLKKVKDAQIIAMQGSTKLARTCQFGRKLTEART